MLVLNMKWKYTTWQTCKVCGPTPTKCPDLKQLEKEPFFSTILISSPLSSGKKQQKTNKQPKNTIIFFCHTMEVGEIACQNLG